jgi:hypothetical protein
VLSGVRIPAKANDFLVSKIFHIGFEAQPISKQVPQVFSGGKVAAV